MADHLSFQTESSRKRNIILQLFFEFFYGIKYTLQYFLGLLIKPGPSTEGHDRPVVLVPGIMGSELAFGKLKKKLLKKGHPVYVFNGRLSFGSVKKKSVELEEFLIEHKITDCFMICHSTGGLAAMGLGYKGRDRIYKLITLGTPFRGSFIALPFFFLPVYWQIRPGSAYLKAMDVNFTTFLNAQSIFAHGDELVLPGRNARLGHFDDVSLNEFGHLNLLMGPSAIECILELIASESAKNPREQTEEQDEEKKEANTKKPKTSKKTKKPSKQTKKKTANTKKAKTKKTTKKKSTKKTKRKR